MNEKLCVVPFFFVCGHVWERSRTSFTLRLSLASFFSYLQGTSIMDKIITMTVYNHFLPNIVIVYLWPSYSMRDAVEQKKACVTCVFKAILFLDLYIYILLLVIKKWGFSYCGNWSLVLNLANTSFMM